MKFVPSALALTVVVAALLVPGYRALQLHRVEYADDYAVAFVYDASALHRLGYIRDAYEEVLREEGIPHRWVASSELPLLDGARLALRYPALVFVDGLDQELPPETLDRVKEYTAAGGDVGVIFDAGIRERTGAYRRSGLFAELLGVQYLRYDALRSGAYVTGRIRFNDAAKARLWQFPEGKLEHGDVVSGYAYGRLDYPLAAAQQASSDAVIYASYNGIPVISLRPVGRGKALWVDLPLGYLKSYSDDLPLRAVLRTFAFDVARVPHLMSAPYGAGGLIIDWHVDSQNEYKGIPNLLVRRLVRPTIKMEFDVTAGPDLHEPDDGLGFDACGKGESYLRAIMQYGEIGSHGGWAHNWFSRGLTDGTIGPKEAQQLIERNNECLAKIASRPVTAYAAPNGVQPQPMIARILERLGMKAYYYTGDSGSPPNRTFFSGRMVSEHVWAVPIMPNGRLASIGEMVKAHIAPADVERWLDATLRYVAEHKTVRLVYSHPYDLLDPSYAVAFGRFLDSVEAMQRKGLVRVLTMSEAADYMERFTQTTYRFYPAVGAIDVRLSNPQGLDGIAVALPADQVRDDFPLPKGLRYVGTWDSYRVFVVHSEAKELAFEVPLAGAAAVAAGGERQVTR